MRHIAAAILDGTTLEELRLGANDISDLGARKLAEALRGARASTGNVTAERQDESQQLVQHRQRCFQLGHLDLRKNRILLQGARELARAAVDLSPPLRRLLLKGNALSARYRACKLPRGPAALLKLLTATEDSLTPQVVVEVVGTPLEQPLGASFEDAFVLTTLGTVTSDEDSPDEQWVDRHCRPSDALARHTAMRGSTHGARGGGTSAATSLQHSAAFEFPHVRGRRAPKSFTKPCGFPSVEPATSGGSLLRSASASGSVQQHVQLPRGALPRARSASRFRIPGPNIHACGKQITLGA